MARLKTSISKIPPSHTVTLIVMILIALGVHLLKITDTDSDTLTRLDDQIERATGLSVLPNTAKWLPAAPEETLTDALRWHTLVFLAKTDADAPGDFYRLDVRAVSPHGFFAVRNLKNLSKSPAGDEFGIEVSDRWVAVKNRVLGQVRSITIYDFNGAPEMEGESSALTRFLGRITNRLEQGQPQGIGKTMIRFASAPEEVASAFQASSDLRLSWQDGAGAPHRAVVAPGKENEDEDIEDIIITTAVRLEKRPILWMVDTVRSFSWIGPGPIEWAEGRFFALKDAFKRTRYRLVGEEDHGSTDDASEAASVAVFDLPEGIEIGQKSDIEAWPPPRFDPPVFKRRIPGEGTWRPAAPEFIRTLPNAPPAFYKSITRTDLSRPYVKVELIAMDMRQLALHMVGGHEDPQSTTGSSGTGRLPRRKAILDRTVAAFNGAFKTEHGAYGMMVDRNVLLPPKDTSATVAAMSDDTTLMGSWPNKMEIPKSMESYRQNMDPLVEDGVVNPRRRYLWGFTLDEDITKMHTIRSGICISEKGYMVYAWGEDLTAVTLGKAMLAAGCNYGLHLDMNPFHTSFIYYRFKDVVDGERPKYTSELALPQMRYSPHRYVNGAPKDFFFLTLRESSPGEGWSAEGLAQPSPAAVPAIFKKSVDDVSLVAVDLSRGFAYLDHGEFPDYLSPTDQPALPDGRENDLLVDITLGPWSSVRGQLANHSVLATMTQAKGTIGVTSEGRLTIAPWPLTPAHENAIQGRGLGSAGAEVQIGAAKKGKWLFVGVGSGNSLERIMKEMGTEPPVAFSSAVAKPSKSSISIRTKQGMADLNGNPVTETDTREAHLRILAKPISLGAKRLEILAPEGVNTPSKKDNKKK